MVLMNKIFILGLTLILVCSIIVIYENIDKTKEDKYRDIYQGPVLIGYDSEHFRNTGETIKEVND